MAFQKAVKSQVPLKLALTGPSGSGKTLGALKLARGLVGEKGRIAFIDTENGSASLYADKYDFDVANVEPTVKTFTSPRGDSQKIKAFYPELFKPLVDDVIASNYDVLIVDSFSHVWEGALAFKTGLDVRGGNSFVNWGDAGTRYANVVNQILQAPLHVVCCFRSKTEYVLETNEKGKSTPRKVGLAPIAREGVEYEFATVFDVDLAHVASASKDRTELFKEPFVITEETGKRLADWLLTCDPKILDDSQLY